MKNQRPLTRPNPALDERHRTRCAEGAHCLWTLISHRVLISHRALISCVVIALLLGIGGGIEGCGGIRSTLTHEVYRDRLEKELSTSRLNPIDRDESPTSLTAELGWWRFLSGDLEGAASLWERIKPLKDRARCNGRTPCEPDLTQTLSSLGRLRLSIEALDAERISHELDDLLRAPTAPRWALSLADEWITRFVWPQTKRSRSMLTRIRQTQVGVLEKSEALCRRPNLSAHIEGRFKATTHLDHELITDPAQWWRCRLSVLKLSTDVETPRPLLEIESHHALSLYTASTPLSHDGVNAPSKQRPSLDRLELSLIWAEFFWRWPAHLRLLSAQASAALQESTSGCIWVHSLGSTPPRLRWRWPTARVDLSSLSHRYAWGRPSDLFEYLSSTSLNEASQGVSSPEEREQVLSATIPGPSPLWSEVAHRWTQRIDLPRSLRDLRSVEAWAQAPPSLLKEVHSVRLFLSLGQSDRAIEAYRRARVQLDSSISLQQRSSLALDLLSLSLTDIDRGRLSSAQSDSHSSDHAQSHLISKLERAGVDVCELLNALDERTDHSINFIHPKYAAWGLQCGRALEVGWALMGVPYSEDKAAIIQSLKGHKDPRVSALGVSAEIESTYSRSGPQEALEISPTLSVWAPLISAYTSQRFTRETDTRPPRLNSKDPKRMPMARSPAQSWRDHSEEEWTPLWIAADLLMSLGASMKEVISPLLRLDLTSERARLWHQAQPQLAPLASFNQSTEMVIKEYERARWTPLTQGAIGQVFESHLIVYHPQSGSAVRWVHEVLRVNSKRGVEELGELDLPRGATLIELYSRKPNGGARAPLILPQKEGYSLQDLQRGDYIIARYVEPLEPLRRSGGVLSPRLYIQDPTRAIWRRQFILLVPQSNPRAQANHSGVLTQWLNRDRSTTDLNDLSSSTPRPQVRYSAMTQDDGDLYQLEIHRAHPAPYEAHAPHQSYTLPSLRLGTPTRWADEQYALYRELAPLLRVGPKISRWLKSLFPKDQSIDRGLRGPAMSNAQMAKLTRAVWSILPEETPLLESPPASHIIDLRRGNRALLLSAALTALNEPHQLLLARPLLYTPTAPFLAVDDFPHPLIQWRGGLVDPAVYLSPPGVITLELIGGQSVVVWRGREGLNSKDFSTSPQGRSRSLDPLKRAQDPRRELETHEVELHLRLDDQVPPGVLDAELIHGRATHHLKGAEGMLLFSRLERASMRERSKWLEGQWAQWMGACTVQDVVFSEPTPGTLTLSYSFSARLRLPFTFKVAPQEWGARYASLSKRSTPLILSPINQRVHITLDGLALSQDRDQERSQELNFSSIGIEGGTFRGRFELDTSPDAISSRSSECAPPKALQLRWSLSAGALSEVDYERWVQFAHAVSQAETLKIQRAPLKACPHLTPPQRR